MIIAQHPSLSYGSVGAEECIQYFIIFKQVLNITECVQKKDRLQELLTGLSVQLIVVNRTVPNALFIYMLAAASQAQ